jgi:hypothetical protein
LKCLNQLKKGVVDPKVQATSVDVRGKGLLLEEENIKPQRPVTSQMLINKFQRWKEKAKGGEDWARRNEERYKAYDWGSL